MNRLFLIACALFGVSLAEEIKAHVKLTNYADGTPKDGGFLDLVQKDGKLTITGEVHNLFPGAKHGFHIHENGSIDNACKAAGAHYNPLKNTHGGPTDKIRHIGDLGNIETDENGNAKVSITDSIALLDGEHSVLNRAIVIHKKEDDLGKVDTDDSRKTGSAGDRILCGVIEKQETASAFTSTLNIFALGLLMYTVFH